MSEPSRSWARLGVNIDHIATLRQLRGTPYPDLVEAARLVEKAGGDQITVHLREDRRHIQDDDVRRLRAESRLPLNLEMAASDAMVRFATKVGPDWTCIVPERRQEVTTEGGLDLERQARRVGQVVQKLKKAGIKVSLFVEPSVKAMKLSAKLGADAVELHTGRFCLATQAPGLEGAKPGSRAAKKAESERMRILSAGREAVSLGLACHAGHGFDYLNVRQLVSERREDGSPLIEEYNIGHAIVCRAALVGLERAVREMVSAIAAP